ncbi:unnamed protein product [Mytilus edulis]|uniref:Uncharacterized protein n=1 Tax=Mytilus edulis TaxID=6550 RepID=A0A8S3VEE7_MYTED|nr:unnamed protein product [Mytilus edulis]
MKESLSDVQVFLATKSIGEKLREQQEWVSTLCNQDEAKESVVELISDPHLTYLLSDLNCFGLIQIVRNPCQIRVRVWEEQRAQINVATTTVRDIGNVKLELIRKISFEHVEGLTSIKDCVLVKDGRMIFANSQTNKVLVHSHDGQLLNTVTVGKSPFGLAVINSNTVAVTCLENQTIQIVNIDDGVVKQTIHVGKLALVYLIAMTDYMSSLRRQE